MSVRFRRALVVATALSCLSVVGLQATAAMAAEQPDGGERTVSASAAYDPGSVDAFSEPTRRPVEQYPALRPIWCTDATTGEVFQCGWES
jgi:hypothetical protein